MRKAALGILLALAIGLGGGVHGTALADVSNAEGTNLQDGDNSAATQQGGSSSSGDAVGGQVTGVVSSGDTEIDARNRSEDVDIESGASSASSTISAIVGHNSSTNVGVGTADVEGSCNDDPCGNVQDGDNDIEVVQAVSATSGDAVGGQVIGAVVSSAGSADIVADNRSEDVDVETGDAEGDVGAGAFVGLNGAGSSEVGTADVSDSCDDGCANVQDGSNEVLLDQASTASSGDSVGGQVIGAVSAGDTSIDSRNVSEDVDVATGNAFAENGAGIAAGLHQTSGTFGVGASDVSGSCDGGCSNVQEGDNEIELLQDASASSGDGVGGTVIGAVTSAGGSAEIVADNRSEDADIETGESVGRNAAALVAGSATSTFADVGAADIQGSCDSGGCLNVQEGDNAISGRQSAAAASGDAVGGQVLGVVSAGDAEIDARNRSEDVDVASGESTAENAASVFAGLSTAGFTSVGNGVGASDIEDATATNILEGDNESTFGQLADSRTGDAVAGQVAGVVTSAGGSADLVIDNGSEDVDASTGENTFENDLSVFVGLNFSNGFGGIAPGDASQEEELQ